MESKGCSRACRAVKTGDGPVLLTWSSLAGGWSPLWEIKLQQRDAGEIGGAISVVECATIVGGANAMLSKVMRRRRIKLEEGRPPEAGLV